MQLFTVQCALDRHGNRQIDKNRDRLAFRLQKHHRSMLRTLNPLGTFETAALKLLDA